MGLYDGLQDAFQLPEGGATPVAANPVVKTMVDEMRSAGMSDNAIRGVLANSKDESGFNPGLRHPDQPRWGGEAHYAHGLYQEGGGEWNNYANWLKQNYPEANWQDPSLQTRFLAQNLKQNYPGVWQRLNNGTPEEAAQAFVSGYLKPAKQYEAARSAAYGRGVPGIDDFLNGKSANYSVASNAPASTGAAPGFSLASAPVTAASLAASSSDGNQDATNRIANTFAALSQAFKPQQVAFMPVAQNIQSAPVGVVKVNSGHPLSEV